MPRECWGRFTGKPPGAEVSLCTMKTPGWGHASLEASSVLGVPAHQGLILLTADNVYRAQGPVIQAIIVFLNHLGLLIDYCWQN